MYIYIYQSIIHSFIHSFLGKSSEVTSASLSLSLSCNTEPRKRERERVLTLNDDTVCSPPPAMTMSSGTHHLARTSACRTGAAVVIVAALVFSNSLSQREMDNWMDG